MMQLSGLDGFQGFGDIASDIANLGPAASTVDAILSDPYFPTVVQKIQTLQALAPSTSGTQGVNLAAAVPLLDAYIFYVQYPWAPFVIGGGLILLLVLAGKKAGEATCAARVRARARSASVAPAAAPAP